MYKYISISRFLFHLGVFLLISTFALVSGWVNQYDQPFTFTCPAHQYIAHIKSIHDNGPEDRVFDFQCKPLSGGEHASCYWTSNISLYLHSQCFLLR